MQCSSPVPIKRKKPLLNETKIQEVPCGKCGACKSNRRKSWSFRLKEEAKAAENSWFVTLTYRNEELPVSESGLFPTLKKDDWKLFLKRLRERMRRGGFENLRYYGVGEYGSKTGRPHYHGILFNVPADIISCLDDIWVAGHCRANRVSEARIHYVTKFHVNRNEEDREIEREEEFATMSKNPGIGYQYIERNGKWHKENLTNYVINNGYKQKLPRYYREKIFTDEEIEQLRAQEQERFIENYKEEIERLKSLDTQGLIPECYIQYSKHKSQQQIKPKNENNIF